MTELLAPQRMIELEVDGQPVRVFEGSTILDACTRLGIDTPTLCYGETLEPANVCRVCVVEVEGSRVLVPACSRKAEPGMKVHTDSERVRLSRKLVLELLASSVDLSTTPVAPGYLSRYDAEPERFGPPAPPSDDRDRARTGHHVEPDGRTAATVHQPVKVDNELYVRDYSKCILCYKCVDACGEQHQSTFAIHVAGRGFDARISTELEHAAARVGLRLLRQLHRGLPDRRAHVPLGARASCRRGLARGRADGDRDDCPYCGVGCSLELHVQDNRIVKVTSPADHDITLGNLCIKGRFGFPHVHPDATGRRLPPRSRPARLGPLAHAAGPTVGQLHLAARDERGRPVRAVEREPAVRSDAPGGPGLSGRPGHPVRAARCAPRARRGAGRARPAPRVVAVLEELEQRRQQHRAVERATRGGQQRGGRQARLGR